MPKTFQKCSHNAQILEWCVGLTPRFGLTLRTRFTVSVCCVASPRWLWLWLWGLVWREFESGLGFPSSALKLIYKAGRALHQMVRSPSRHLTAALGGFAFHLIHVVFGAPYNPSHSAAAGIKRRLKRQVSDLLSLVNTASSSYITWTGLSKSTGNSTYLSMSRIISAQVK